MNKQTIVIVVAAIALFVAALLGTTAFTGSDSNPGGNVHQLPDGSRMTDPMTTTKPTPDAFPRVGRVVGAFGRRTDQPTKPIQGRSRRSLPLRLPVLGPGREPAH